MGIELARPVLSARAGASIIVWSLAGQPFRHELCYLSRVLCVWDAEVFTGEFGALGDRKTLKPPLASEP